MAISGNDYTNAMQLKARGRGAGAVAVEIHGTGVRGTGRAGVAAGRDLWRFSFPQKKILVSGTCAPDQINLITDENAFNEAKEKPSGWPTDVQPQAGTPATK